MRVTLLAIGSQGDVQPYVALALGLRSAGLQVKLASYANFQGFAESRGLDFFPIFGDYQKVIQGILGGPLGEQLTARSKNPVKVVRALRELNKIMNPVREQALRDSWKAIEDSDFVIHNRVSYACFGRPGDLLPPMCEANIFPFSSTENFPSYICPSLPEAVSFLNKTSHAVADQLLWQSSRAVVNQWRTAERGLKPLPFLGFHRNLDRERRPHLYAFSPAVVPKPRDWPEWVHVTGYWFLDVHQDWVPPQALQDFLDAGTPPIAVGYSSASTEHPEVLTRLVVEAVRKTKQRAILLSGWAGLGKMELPEFIFCADFIPHSWLFPRCMAAIHHGGAGTLAVALRAGIPSIIMPVAADQPFWAKRMESLGASPPPLWPRKATPDLLAEAITRVSSDMDMRMRTVQIGRQIANESGVEIAVEVLQEHFRRIQ